MKFILFFILFFISFNAVSSSLDEKTAQVVIPFGPGGGTDTIFRRMQQYGAKTNVNLKPLYRPGANGLIGVQTLYELPADGQNFGIITFDTLTLFSAKNSVDLNNVITVQKNIFGIVSTKPGNLNEIVNSSKTQPLKIGYLLVSQKVILERMFKAYGVTSEQIYVPYKTGSEMTQNLISGDLDLGITSLNVLAPLVKNNRLRLLAVDSTDVVKDFSDAFLLKNLDPVIPSINKGSSLVLPPNSSMEHRKYWTKFVTDYLNDPDSKKDSLQNFWEPIRKTTRELEKDLSETSKLLQ